MTIRRVFPGLKTFICTPSQRLTDASIEFYKLIFVNWPAQWMYHCSVSIFHPGPISVVFSILEVNLKWTSHTNARACARTHTHSICLSSLETCAASACPHVPICDLLCRFIWPLGVESLCQNYSHIWSTTSCVHIQDTRLICNAIHLLKNITYELDEGRLLWSLQKRVCWAVLTLETLTDLTVNNSSKLMIQN